MHSTCRLNADELSPEFIKAIKKVYSHKNIEIVVQDVEDDTEYLLRSDANRNHLLSAIQNVEQHKDLVEMDINNL